MVATAPIAATAATELPREFALLEEAQRHVACALLLKGIAEELLAEPDVEDTYSGAINYYSGSYLHVLRYASIPGAAQQTRAVSERLSVLPVDRLIEAGRYCRDSAQGMLAGLTRAKQLEVLSVATGWRDDELAKRAAEAKTKGKK